MTETISPTTRGENTRQAILEAGYSLFIEHGFHATSMRRIAERAGIAVGGIYNHFASKNAIFDVLILEKHPYRQILPILQSAPGDTIETFVQNAARTIIAELDRRPDFMKLIFIEITEFKGRHVPLIFQVVYPQIAQLLERFRAHDDRLREIDLPVIMRTFIGMLFSYYIMEYLTGPNELPGMATGSGAAGSGATGGGAARSGAEEYVDIFLHGILKSPEGV